MPRSTGMSMLACLTCGTSSSYPPTSMSTRYLVRLRLRVRLRVRLRARVRVSDRVRIRVRVGDRVRVRVD